MNKSQAKKVLLEQKRKLDGSDQWIVQTSSIIESIFSKGSNEYLFMYNLRFTFPNTGQDQEEFMQQYEGRMQEVRVFLDNCVETVYFKGVYKPETRNFLGRYTNSEIFTAAAFIATAIVSVTLYTSGQALESKINVLSQENRILRDSLSLRITASHTSNKETETRTPKEDKNRQ